MAFNKTILPFLEKFTKDQLVDIIKGTNQNFQLYGRVMAKDANNKIVKYALTVLDGFDFNSYPYFEYDVDTALTEP